MLTRIGVAGAAALSVVMMLGATPAAAAGEVSPLIATGRAYGPRPVGTWTAPRLISKLLLTPGNWVVTANATLRNETSSRLSVRCILKVGSYSDTSWISLRANSWATLFSHLVATTPTSMPNGTPLDWRCASRTGADGAVTVREVQMTGIQAGQVRRVNMETGSATTTGTGGPNVITGNLAGPIGIPVTSKTLASMTLPVGRWIVMGKAIAINNNSADDIGVQCSLSPGHDSSRTLLGDAGSQLERGHMAWQAHVVKARGTVNLQLACRAGLAGVKLSSVRLTAIKVPGSFSAELPTTVASSQPAQVFWKDSERESKTYWADQLMPNGNWSVLVTAELYHPFQAAAGGVSCEINSVSGAGQRAEAGVTLHPVTTPGSQFAFTMGAAFTINSSNLENRHIEINCLGATGEGAFTGGRIAHLRVVMVNATSIWEQTI